MRHTLFTYAALLVSLLVLDAGWLSLVALPMFKQTLGADLLTFRAVPGVLFYLVYAVGLLVFVMPATQRGALLWRGALFGFCAYATYDLTNYATLKPWTLPLAATDIAWGSVLSASAALIASFVP